MFKILLHEFRAYVTPSKLSVSNISCGGFYFLHICLQLIKDRVCGN